MFEFINYETQEQTAVITIRRPQVYNAMNVQTKKEIITAIKQANKDTQIRSLILTGEGKAFTTGQDLNDRSIQAAESAVDLGNTLKTEWNPLVMAIRQSEKLVIAAINGVCAGAGLAIAFACDLKVSKPATKFVSGFAKLGLAPDAGTVFHLVKSLGYSQALAFILEQKTLLTEDLVNAGLINHVAEDVLNSALELSHKVNQLAPLSVQLMKKNLQFSQNHSIEECMEREVSTQRFLGHTLDYQEGVQAFLEKRLPKFQGA